MSVPRAELADRLRARRPEIEQALFLRTAAVPSATGSDDPEYRAGFRTIVPAAFDFSLSVVESQMGDIPPLPAELLVQARLAARHQVALATVLRGYVVGSTRMDDFIIDECDDASIQSLLRSRAVALDHLLSQISAEYESERLRREGSRELRALERIRALLRGEPLDETELDYDLDHNHVALVIHGTNSRGLLRALASSVDSRLLLVRVDADAAWAWLGRRGPLHAEDVQLGIASTRASKMSVGIGESARGVDGWRHTHRQARAALPVALRSATHTARYADVCLVASAMQDTLLMSSLREVFLQPLLVGKDEGATHLRTLRAYFAAGRNGVATAAALGVSRQTINNRLRAIEDRLGRPIVSAAAAIELALQVNAVEQYSPDAG